MSRLRAGIGALTLLLAVAGALAAKDLHGWDGALERNRAYDALLPGDPIGRALGAEGELRYRSAVQTFTTALRTERGFDNGERRARVRSAAEALLSEVATTAAPAKAGQAQTLLGVLVASGGRVTGGESAQERARSAFETAVRIDPANVDAKYDLELLLRRERPTATGEGRDNGSGPRGSSQRGAGSGTPGRGY